MRNRNSGEMEVERSDLDEKEDLTKENTRVIRLTDKEQRNRSTHEHAATVKEKFTKGSLETTPTSKSRNSAQAKRRWKAIASVTYVMGLAKGNHKDQSRKHQKATDEPDAARMKTYYPPKRPLDSTSTPENKPEPLPRQRGNEYTGIDEVLRKDDAGDQRKLMFRSWAKLAKDISHQSSVISKLSKLAIRECLLDETL
ncbi:hypothetical protein TcWFU_010540 [Taenia crassiceps]|uniref:Uncharacterized protein n=1 Tax=Taenia crassiceps TaxID=6207 RepID=A0ABR4Q5U8_9CEST